MSFRLKSLAVLCAFSALISLQSVSARTADEVRAVCRQEGRPCVGLVLSGGGARGFAHAGIIKVLEELNVKIDVVTGTSMGSMVGGAYAAGYSADQLADIITGVDWDKMMAPRADRREIPWRLKADDYKNLPANAIEFTKEGKVKLPDSVIPSEELDLFLNNKTGPVNYVNDLSELALPFACVATNLVTGERRVLQKGVNLGLAMRASMSVPGAFAPVTVENDLLVDGGLVDNLPVKLAREMGADVIIAVNVGTPLLKRSELGNVVTVMAQMVNLLTEQNVRQSLSELTDKDILITPDLGELSSADFKKNVEIIAVGREAALAHKDELARFSVPRETWLAWEQNRERAVLPSTRRTEHQLAEVRVEGLKIVNPEAVRAEIDLPTDRPVSNAEIDEASRRVWADGLYSSVRYRFEPGPDGTEVLVIEPQERKPGHSSIRIGGALETNFEDEHTFNVLLAHTWGWLNDAGAELRTEVQLGERRRFMTEFFQPLGPGSDWFFDPRLEYKWQPYDIYENGKAVARFRNETFMGELALGYTIDRLGYAKTAIGYGSQLSNHVIGTIEPQDGRVNAPYIRTELLLDALDNVNFPTKGFWLNAEAERFYDETGQSGHRNLYRVDALLPLSYGRWTTLLGAKVGKAAMPNYFTLGGAFELTGSPYGRWTGADMQLATVRLSRNVSDIFGSASQPIWVGGSLEVGRAWNRNDDTESGDDGWRRAAGAYIGVDSLIGPIYLMTGHTADEGWGFYFFWGRKY